MTEEFNLMKELRKKEKEEKIKFEGAILAFRLPNGMGGTGIFCNELGIVLRLINEAKLQERIIEIQNEDIASINILNKFSDQKEEKRSPMFG